ncbi:hypothetical protein [uncultured Mucilaginibacter sp.]|uniref:hypothetical protein n=1 Tax=uncultured Mucilaginibacter sp. TaxID=797541 RepID=UPI0025D5CD0D|nr:hypothetical protein [uncultured Mucilaginibacter sp.]
MKRTTSLMLLLGFIFVACHHKEEDCLPFISPKFCTEWKSDSTGCLRLRQKLADTLSKNKRLMIGVKMDYLTDKLGMPIDTIKTTVGAIYEYNIDCKYSPKLKVDSELLKSLKSKYPNLDTSAAAVKKMEQPRITHIGSFMRINVDKDNIITHASFIIAD